MDMSMHHTCWGGRWVFEFPKAICLWEMPLGRLGKEIGEIGYEEFGGLGEGLDGLYGALPFGSASDKDLSVTWFPHGFSLGRGLIPAWSPRNLSKIPFEGP